MGDKPDQNEEITLTRGELEEILTKRERDAKMPDDEKRIRTMIREEVRGSLREELDDLFKPDDGGEGADRTQSPGSGSKGLDAFLGIGKAAK